MTEVLTLMLLVYPGAWLDVFYKWIAKERYDDEGDPDIMRMAKYFVWSGVISILTLFFLSFIWWNLDIRGDIYAALAAIQRGWNTVIYVLVATGVSFLGALARKYGYDRFIRYLHDKKSNSIVKLDYKDAWNEILYNPDYDISGCVCAIFEQDKLITCGYAGHLPDDILRKPSLALDHSDYITPIFAVDEDRTEDEKFIGEQMAEYMMLDSGYSIRFYKAPKLIEYMEEHIISSETSKERVAAVASGSTV